MPNERPETDAVCTPVLRIEEEPKNKDVGSNGHSPRLVSLDALRGLTILGMLLVNNTVVGVYTPAQFEHAPWNGGVHIADLVLPWFLFIVGVTIPFSDVCRHRRALSGTNCHLKIFSRAITLVLLGCLLDSSIMHTPYLGLGILQLIGLVYLCTALLYQFSIRWSVGIAGVLLVAHWAAMRFIPIPGIGAGVFTEHQNLIHYLNETYLRQWHLAGIISVIPTTALALLGTVMGEILQKGSYSGLRKFASLLLGGLDLVIIGYIWSKDLPFSKEVWTAPFIVLSAGLGAVALGVFYVVMDVIKWRRWVFPLVIFGMNAIFAYVVPILIKVDVLNVWRWPTPNPPSLTLEQIILQYFRSHSGLIIGGWLYTATYIGFWWLVLLFMYRKRIFLKV